MPDRVGPIALLGPEGELWRLWPAGEKLKETTDSEGRRWRLAVKDVKDAATTPPPRKAKGPPPTGYRVRVCIEGEKELEALGCGWRIVTIELDGPKVHLHHNGNTGTIKREAFKAFLAANKAARRNRPSGGELESAPLHYEPSSPRATAKVLEKFSKRTVPDMPLMPAFLRSKAHLRLVVDNTPTNTGEEEAA